jgi:site-specific recombinase XerD
MKTISIAIDEWEAWLLKKDLAGKTVQNSLEMVNLWMRRSNLANTLPSAIKADDISNYLITNYAKDSTRGVHFSCLVRFFDFCQSQGYAKENPARLVTKFFNETKTEKSESRKKLSDEMVEKLMAETTGFWKVAIVFAYFGGLKFRSIVNLKWSSFKKTGFVTVTDAEDRTTIDIPMTAEMQNAIEGLAHLRNQTSDGYCFPEEKATQDSPTRRALLSVYFGRLCNKVGVMQGRITDLRDLYLRRHVQASQPITLNMDLYDFSSIKTCQVLLH